MQLCKMPFDVAHMGFHVCFRYVGGINFSTKNNPLKVVIVFSTLLMQYGFYW